MEALARGAAVTGRGVTRSLELTCPGGPSSAAAATRTRTPAAAPASRRVGSPLGRRRGVKVLIIVVAVALITTITIITIITIVLVPIAALALFVLVPVFAAALHTRGQTVARASAPGAAGREQADPTADARASCKGAQLKAAQPTRGRRSGGL